MRYKDFIQKTSESFKTVIGRIRAVTLLRYRLNTSELLALTERINIKA